MLNLDGYRREIIYRVPRYLWTLFFVLVAALSCVVTFNIMEEPNMTRRGEQIEAFENAETKALGLDAFIDRAGYSRKQVLAKGKDRAASYVAAAREKREAREAAERKQ